MSRAAIRRSAAWILLATVVLAVTGCGGKKKQEIDPSQLSASATFDRATELLAKRQLSQAMSALKRIQFAPASRAEIEPLTRLALADATFYQGTTIAWIDARNLYLDFVTLNGDHPLAPYAQLQVGLCSLKQVSQPSKDQALTRQAIQDLDAVRRRWPDSRYVDAARSLASEARANLAESEFLIGRFYLKKKNFTAAIDRFRGIMIGFPDYPDVEKVLFHLARAHVLAGNEAEARLYLDTLVTRDPSGAYVSRAQKTLGAMDGDFESELTPPAPTE
jgi:outer membrane protein assembly factor BamD